MAAIYFAETINKLAANNWKHFSRQHYFDPQGVFISVVFSGPLIIISLILLVSFKSNILSLCCPDTTTWVRICRGRSNSVWWQVKRSQVSRTANVCCSCLRSYRMLFLLSCLAGELLVQLNSADCGGEKEGIASESQTTSRRKQEGKVKLDRLGSRIQKWCRYFDRRSYGTDLRIGHSGSWLNFRKSLVGCLIIINI